MDYHFGLPYYVLAKPCGSSCNLRCSYCYFIDKATGRISDALLEQFIRDYIDSQPTENVLFIWHGGEPMLMGLDFYRRVMSLQRQHGCGRNVDNALQTNGTLLNAEWAQFLHDNRFLVGVSIDGPQPLHDDYRKTPTGQGSWQQVMDGIRLLQSHQVEWNAMATVNRSNVEHPLAFYHFLKSIDCRYIQFTPIVERTSDGGMTPETITPRQWGHFLNTIFDDWVKTDVGEYFVEVFDATLANWCGVEPGICSFAPTCGRAMAMQPNGDVYACDHFVDDAHRLGNIHTDALASMAFSTRQQDFGRAKSASLPPDCRQCSYLFACWGGCPKDRIDHGKNYLCEGYRDFFAHVSPTMDTMRDRWKSGLPVTDTPDNS
ncbi:MAG: anaerobic sulfatase maturase [Prevotella sp.]|nr:anaerobic sulfatase maturase [Prevotella sp.]